MPCNMEMKKIGNHSRKILLTPKMLRKLSPRILKPDGKPSVNIRSNFEVPPDSRFMRSPKKRKLGIKPNQKRRSLVASIIPLLAKTNSSSHFLQFIINILS